MLTSKQNISSTFAGPLLSPDRPRERFLRYLYAVIAYVSLFIMAYVFNNWQGDRLSPLANNVQEIAFYVEIVQQEIEPEVQPAPAQPIVEEKIEETFQKVVEDVIEENPDPNAKDAITLQEPVQPPKPRINVTKTPPKKPILKPLVRPKTIRTAQARLPSPITKISQAKKTGFIKPIYPAYLQNPAPPYPRSARRKRQEGVVLLWVRVSEAGRVLQIRLKKTSGYNALDLVALKTVRKWKFVAAKKGRRAVRADVIVPIRFTLKTE